MQITDFFNSKGHTVHAVIVVPKIGNMLRLFFEHGVQVQKLKDAQVMCLKTGKKSKTTIYRLLSSTRYIAICAQMTTKAANISFKFA